MLYSPQFEESQRLSRHYRAYRIVAGKVLFQGGGKVVIHGDPPVSEDPWVNDWILLDCDNGHPDLGYGYCWVFKTRQQARDHRENQNANPELARVRGPWRIAEAKRLLLGYAQRPLRGRLK